MRGRILLVCLLTSALPLGFLTVAMFRQADQLITDHFQPIGESRIAGEALAVCRDITIEKEIDRMKTDFVSQVSHELRTPLTSIQVCTEMLLDGEVESAGEQKDYLRIIFDESERLTRLINDLLDIARTESGRRVIKPVPLDLASLACNVAAVLAGMAESRRYGKGSTFTVRFRAVAPA
ncbi:MAG: hypothetical protein GX442_15415 [Candidatus Riflebacteria bacterium]|nr:hypothetical protein [Candidatus Riflebacteria bacterium]